MELKELIAVAFEIAGLGLSMNSEDMAIHDWRSEKVNPFWNQTQSGLFIEMYYGVPGDIYTPLGKWNCWGGGHGRFDFEEFFKRHMQLTVAVDYRESHMGRFGPVFAVHSFKGIALPEPIMKVSNDDFIPYEVANQQWQEIVSALASS
jgi:hypothetical protein